MFAKGCVLMWLAGARLSVNTERAGLRLSAAVRSDVIDNVACMSLTVLHVCKVKSLQPSLRTRAALIARVATHAATAKSCLIRP